MQTSRLTQTLALNQSTQEWDPRIYIVPSAWGSRAQGWGFEPQSWNHASQSLSETQEFKG